MTKGEPSQTEKRMLGALNEETRKKKKKTVGCDREESTRNCSREERARRQEARRIQQGGRRKGQRTERIFSKAGADKNITRKTKRKRGVSPKWPAGGTTNETEEENQETPKIFRTTAIAPKRHMKKKRGPRPLREGGGTRGQTGPAPKSREKKMGERNPFEENEREKALDCGIANTYKPGTRRTTPGLLPPAAGKEGAPKRIPGRVASKENLDRF